MNSRGLNEENQLRFTNSKHFRFYQTKKHFISEWYFAKNHEIGSLVVRKVKKSWESRQNRELAPAWESKSSCCSFRHVYRVDESKSFKCLFEAFWLLNFCLKVDHSANLKHSKSTWRQLIVLSSKALGREIKRNSLDLRQTFNWPRGNEFLRAHYVTDSVKFKLATKTAQICDQPKECEESGRKRLGSSPTKLVTPPWRINCILLRRTQ